MNDNEEFKGPWDWNDPETWQGRTPKEVEVARRNLIAQLKAESIGNLDGIFLESQTIQDLIEVLEASGRDVTS